jgi:hypothetical protein
VVLRKDSKSERLTPLQMQNWPTCGCCLGSDSAVVLNSNSGAHHIPQHLELHTVLRESGSLPEANE